MTEEVKVPEGEATPVTPAGGEPGGEVQTQETQATAEGGQAADQQKEGEKTGEEPEEHRKSRAARRLDRWRQRAIEAETRLKLQEEARAKPAEAKAPEEGPKREEFATYEEWLRADAQHTARKVAREEAARVAADSRKDADQERAKAEHAAVAKAFNARVEAARDEIEDFDEVCGTSDAPLTPAMNQAILESEQGARIAYYLAQNESEAERISKLSPARQAAAIFALEDKVAKPAAKQASKAPPPINPVGGKSAGDKAVDPTNPASDKLATDEWIRRRKEALAARSH